MGPPRGGDPLSSEPTLEAWWAEGEPHSVTLPTGRYSVQARVRGDGPWLTLLHGFPASSYEWARISPELERHHRVLSFDFLGYGRSDKPPGHRYSVREQADLVVSLWRTLGVTETGVVAYDYGAIVAQELLARRREHALPVSLTAGIFLNAGLDAAAYRPRPTQRLMLVPGLGVLVARLFTEPRFTAAWSEVFSDAHPLDPEVARAHYRALREGNASGEVQRRLLAYIPERVALRERLEGALAATDVPLHFLWGMADPVSGAPIARSLQAKRPGLDLVAYADAGHCPHLEIPERVAADILARTAARG